MTLTSIGDLATMMTMRMRNAALRDQLQDLTNELSTGVTNDVHDRLGGDYSYLAQIDRDLSRLEGYSLAATEAGVLFAAANKAVERVNGIMVDLADRLIAPVQLTGVAEGRLATEATEMLREAMMALSVQSAGRFVFSGTDVDAGPLGDLDTLLGDLATEISGETSAADVLAAATAWFDDPAGFEAAVYGGSTDPLDTIHIGIDQEVEMTVTARDDRLKQTYRTLALSALMTNPTLGFSDTTIADLTQMLLADTLQNQNQLAFLTADLGFAIETVTDQIARNASESTSLQYARGTLLSANPYETAVELQNVQTQLDSFYAVLSRSSSLSLVNYL